MIFDAHGKPLVRRIGFLGGLQMQRGPRASASLLALIACDKVWPDDENETNQAPWPDEEEAV